jgi:hypothetical protein
MAGFSAILSEILLVVYAQGLSQIFHHQEPHHVRLIEMKVLSIGLPLQEPEVDTTDLDSNRSLLDYDVVLFDPAPYLSRALITDRPAIPFEAMNAVISNMNRRRKEVLEFLEHGRLVIQFPFPPIRYMYVNKFGHQVTDTFPDSTYREPLPPTEGRNIAIADNVDPPIWEFVSKLRSLFRYRTALPEIEHFRAALVIEGTKKIIGQYAPKDLRMLLLPILRISDAPSARLVVDAIRTLLQEYGHQEQRFVFPDWHSRFTTSNESLAIEAADQLSTQVFEAQDRLSDAKSKLGHIQTFKRLFLARDQQLVDAVQQTLTALGMSVRPGVKTKDDLIAEHGSQVMVIEVKGRDTKGGAERDSQQLEKWISDYSLNDEGKTAKGLLVLNAFKDIPLDKRTQDVFPHPMVEYSRKRDHCLISGIQLFCLLVESLNDERRKEESIKKLFQCVGVFPEYQGDAWQRFLITKHGTADEVGS